MKEIVVIVLLSLFSYISAHGYLTNPPARNYMWRKGFKNPPNYNDNEQFCGGANYQRMKGGKCGVCGDGYGQRQRHAYGGKYANGIIVKTYKQGATIDITVTLTASHLGYFEFRIADFSGKAEQHDKIGKLSGHWLKIAGTNRNQYIVKSYGGQTFHISLQLPRDLTCNQCVLQWWYRGGNNWGCEGRGSSRRCGMGYGPQEHFVNCADVEIVSSNQPPATRPPQTNVPETQQPPVTRVPVTKPVTERKTSGPGKRCRANKDWQHLPSMNKWCHRNCNNPRPYCPKSHCTCD